MKTRAAIIGFSAWTALVTLGTLAALACAAVLAAPAHGQQPDGGRLTADELLLLLADEKVVSAGVGFPDVRLGDPMRLVIDTWGRPDETRRSLLTGAALLVYRPDPATRVVFIGYTTVNSIRIQGTTASFIRTRRGARFGFTPQQVLRMYSPHAYKTGRKHIRFPAIGLEFSFEDDRVDGMRVTAPKDA